MRPDQIPEKGRIMVVDNDKLFANMVQMVLSGEGYEVQACYDPREAIKDAKKFHPNLFILDVMMDIPGPELLRTIDEDDELRNTPAIIMSATESRDSEILGECLQTGRADFMHKMFEIDNFIGLVGVKLDGHQPPQP